MLFCYILVYYYNVEKANQETQSTWRLNSRIAGVTYHAYPHQRYRHKPSLSYKKRPTKSGVSAGVFKE